MSRRSSRIQFGFTDLDRYRRAPIGLIQTSEASVRQPPAAAGIAAQEGSLRDCFSLHVISASRTEGLCPNRDTPCVTHRPLQRGVILHKEIHLSHIEPESVSRRTDIEPRTLVCRNRNKILPTIGAFHGDHRVQTVARISQVSKRNTCIRFEKAAVYAWLSESIHARVESDGRSNRHDTVDRRVGACGSRWWRG
jgi:hypothetical protein